MIEVLTSLFLSLSPTDAKEIVQVVEVEAAKSSIDPTLVYSVIAVESRFNKKAIGKSHQERGLMQLNPKYYGQTPLDIKENLKKGIKVLAKYKRLCKTKYGAAWFVCYNTGPGVKLTKPREFPYYKKVMSSYAQIAETLYTRSSTPSGNPLSYACVY